MNNSSDTRTVELKKSLSLTQNQTPVQPLPLKISELRKNHKMSQRELARKLNWPRTYLQRLEGRSWSELSLGEFAALGEIFQFSISEMLRRIVPGVKKPGVERCSLKAPRVVNHHEDGCRISVLSPAEAPYFLGVLTLASGKSFTGAWLPYQGPLSGIVTQGAILITSEMEETYFRENDCFNFSEFSSFEISNTHGFKEASVMMVSSAAAKSV